MFEVGGAANSARAKHLVFSEDAVIDSEARAALALANVAFPRT